MSEQQLNRTEVKRSWWYRLLRSVSMFCFKFWWLIWLLFILFIILWFFFCFRSKKYACEFDNQINTQLALINQQLDSCCDCRTTIAPEGAKPCDYDEREAGGQGKKVNIHNLGDVAGLVTVTYNMNSIPDRIDIYYDEVLVASTNRYVSGVGSLSFYYPAEKGRPNFCKIILSAPKPGTVWSYHIGCPR